MKAQVRLARQWQMLAAISQSRRGLSLAELMDLTERSKATVYRDLQLLIDAGLPLSRENSRYRLLTERELPALGLNALQIASLHLARQQLTPLQGTPVVLELDRLLSALRQPVQESFRFSPSRNPLPDPGVVKTIERAQRYKKRAAIEYRAASRGGASTTVHVEPLLLNVADGEPYLVAYCIERQQERTYKLTRIRHAALTEERATYRPATQPATAFTHSIKAWSGDPQRVRVRLDPSVAWLAREYPLPGQTQAEVDDGSVVVEATVAGLVEAKRRILAWGGNAEVLWPEELRKAVRDELAKALGRYDGPGPVRVGGVSAEKSTAASKRSLRDRETGVG